MNRYRVGVVGTSFGAAVHVPAFRAQGRFDVVAIASPSRAAAVASERAIPHDFSSLDEMLAGVELDVVTIASPPSFHYDHALAALAAGKHLLCEKPMALSVAQAQAMCDAAAASGRVCALAHEFRYLSSWIATRELIANGHLGALRELELTSLSTRLRATGDRPPSWWFERSRGGGLTGAIVSHLIDATLFFAGRAPQKVAGFERTANVRRSSGGVSFESDVADGAFALLDFGDGLVGRVTVDGTRAVESAIVAAHGETRTVVTTGKNLVDTTTFTVDEDETAELDLRPLARAKLAAAHPNIPPFAALLDAFAAALDGEPTDIATFPDGLATQRVLEAIGYTWPR